MRADANERRVGESDAAYRAYLQYRDTPHPRTMRSARRRVTGRADAQTPNSWRIWSEEHDWDARCAAWDGRHVKHLPSTVPPDREVLPHDVGGVDTSRREALETAAVVREFIADALRVLGEYGGTRVQLERRGAKITIDLGAITNLLAEWRNVVAWGRQVPPEITAALHAVMLQRGGGVGDAADDLSAEDIAAVLSALPSRRAS